MNKALVAISVSVFLSVASLANAEEKIHLAAAIGSGAAVKPAPPTSGSSAAGASTATAAKGGISTATMVTVGVASAAVLAVIASSGSSSSH